MILWKPVKGMVMRKKLNIGIVGAGKIVWDIHLPLLTCFDNVKIKYIADVRDIKEIAKSYKAVAIKVDDDPSILPDCDIVLLATPVGVREPYIQEFGKRGIPIFSEKPFAANLEAHKKFLKLTNRVTCNYMKIYYSSIRQMREIISSGIFGRLRKIVICQYNSLRRTGKPKDHYQTNPALSGGGILIEKGCHTLSQLMYILGDCDIVIHEAYGVWLHGLDFHIQTVFDTIDEDQIVRVEFTISYLKPSKTFSKFIFDAAEVMFNHASPHALRIKPRSNSKENGFLIAPDKRWATTQYQAFYLKWKDFIDKICTEKVIDTASETSIKTTELITEIYKKAEREER